MVRRIYRGVGILFTMAMSLANISQVYAEWSNTTDCAVTGSAAMLLHCLRKGVSLPEDIVPGDVDLVCYTKGQGSPITPPAGWTTTQGNTMTTGGVTFQKAGMLSVDAIIVPLRRGTPAYREVYLDVFAGMVRIVPIGNLVQQYEDCKDEMWRATKKDDRKLEILHGLPLTPPMGETTSKGREAMDRPAPPMFD